MEITAEVFGNALRKAMLDCEITNLAAANKSGKPPSTLSQIKGGHINPTMATFCEVLTACEELHPGFFRIFAAKLAGISLPSTTPPPFSADDTVAPLDATQLSALLNAIGTRIVIDAKKIEKKDKAA